MLNVKIYFLLLFCVVIINSCDITSKFQDELVDNPAVKRLQKYIQIDTSVPENIEKAVYFWERQAAELGLPFAVHRPAGLPICVITVKGTKPELPSIMLNSHADVVPVEADMWTYHPFSAHIDDQGYLYGRGAQDCKSTGVQYLEAIRTLLRQNITLERTVYITIMPDEETGGFRGMIPFVKTKEFKLLNVGFALDEGVPSPNDVLYALYVDKRPWQMKFEIQGTGGHGSQLKTGTTLEQVQTLLNTAMAYRNLQLEILKSAAETDYGVYSSLNINMIHGGTAANVVPTSMSMVIDVRLAVNETVSNFQSMINTWMAKLGNNTKLEFLRNISSSEPTSIDDSNQYWVAMRDTISKLWSVRQIFSRYQAKPLGTSENVFVIIISKVVGLIKLLNSGGRGRTVMPIVCSGTTDMLEIRALGIPAFGFTTNSNITLRAHDVDEYVSVTNYIQGIGIYASLIEKLANLPI